MRGLSCHDFAFKAMGSPCEIRLYARDAAHAHTIFDTAAADIARLEAKYSRYRETSLLSQINRVAAVGGRIELDPETASLIDYADACYRQSDGLFDISSGLLRQAWNFKSGCLPTEETLARLLPRVGWQRLRWQRPWLEFAPGMELDFGGIVKEYAADRAAALCRERGAAGAIVNLGGDVCATRRPDGAPWRVGVQHPRDPGAMLETVTLTHGGIATSGDYERCMVIDGVRYGHVLNPRTGQPVRHLAAVSVVADLCVVAGSASTIAMLKEADGPAWLEQLGLPYCWVDAAGRVRNALRGT